MSFYTSSIKTEYLQPNIYSATNRVEYRFSPEQVYLTNMRLLELAYTTTSNTVSRSSGVMEYVNTLELFDGAKRLTRVTNAGSVYSFMRYNTSNDFNIGYTGMDKTALGLIYAPDGIGSGATDNEIRHAQSVPSPTSLTEADDEGFVDLSMLMEFLRQSQIIPTTIFKELKLVLTYRDNGDGIFTNGSAPLLAVDTMMNTPVVESLLKNYKGFQWNELEQDQFFVPAVPQNSLIALEVLQQRTKVQLKGFDNKMVARCFIQKQYTSNNFIQSAGRTSSVPMNREVLQVRKNGSNLFPSNGLETPAEIANELVTVWGEFTRPVVGLSYPSTVNPDILAGYYLGFDLTGNRVNELQLEYQRAVYKDENTAPANNNYSQALNMLVYGEVKKVLLVEGGNYRVLYE
jgi:hypothetical protein